MLCLCSRQVLSIEKGFIEPLNEDRVCSKGEINIIYNCIGSKICKLKNQWETGNEVTQ